LIKCGLARALIESVGEKEFICFFPRAWSEFIEEEDEEKRYRMLENLKVMKDS